MTNEPLYARLQAIASRDLDDRTITPGEASYLVCDSVGHSPVASDLYDEGVALGGAA